MNTEKPNFDHRSQQVEQKEKPKFLYHGSSEAMIKTFEPRKRYTPGGQDVPKRVYATDLPAFAAAHSFPWGNEEGFELSIDNGRVVFKVPKMFKDRLLHPVYLYKFPSVFFQYTEGEGTGHTYHVEESIEPSGEVEEFKSVEEAVNHFGGEVVYI